jgi:intracellular multiplication protein IcmC
MSAVAASFDLSTALTRLSYSFDMLVQLIVAVSYITGLSLVVRGLMMYKVFATQTLSSAHKGEFAGPLVHIVVGAILIYFPSTLNTTLNTLFVGVDQNSLSTASQMIGYQSLQNDAQWTQIADVVVKYVKLVGLIAFVRGWVILSKMGHAGSQPGSIAKGIIHIVGGVLLINIVDTFRILAVTFGYTG